ncbi:FKBP-type peptidyl-prolyl cis-trans isomerase [Agrococcus sp. HG114]|uniref:FKBP-type peptidyl-prolyl cis-trans isomerase n=1 Tax=Agrococcus sp. HG114 TaxID=2969757 RepID=UPI00215B648E|nr:FKBP-type peptidyl-prolyl cis-trans isomerase [Agrococcus sp. HG114]MCR8669707.1 FKBP-type peptidyl-prolyl cis-trans isomerase [Agrococcus sp. HG114]
MRTRPLSIAALLVAAAGLTACQAPAGSLDGCTPLLQPGAATDQVSVDASAEVPEATFEIPLVSDGAQAQVHGGAGERAEEGATVDADYIVYSGKTGDIITTSYAVDGSPARPSNALRVAAGAESVLAQAVECAAPGSRVVLTTTIGEVYGPAASSEALDLTPADTAVVVLGVSDVRPGRAEGNPKPGQQGMPAIALAPNGQPGVTFPGSPAPAELTVMQSIEGTGPEVAEGDTVLLHYTGIIWETEEVFDSSWEKGSPTEMTIDDANLIPGFVDAVVGQPVGSQVVVSIPQELGYADPATRPASIGEGQHLLFVIDILDRVEPAAE